MFRRKGLILIFVLAASGAPVFFNFARRAYVVPILMYHSVDSGGVRENRLVVSPGTFERQMRFLKERRYNVVTLEELSALIAAKSRIPDKTVAITFDDGYRDNFTRAFPVLKKYGLKATVFIIVDEVGRPQADRLDWQDLKQMQSSGLVTIGSHAMGPEPLTKISSGEELRRQIFGAKKALEEKLGVPVEFFAYPEGRFDAHIRQLVRDAGYGAAVATSPGREYPNDDIYALKRIRISESAKNLFVFWVETSGFYTFMKERRRK
ncbi:MAG: polysaccharide deacetylase family protein [Candidatus Omnitrophica bacterium]|nr:polysaccharide deacetylase family protein [Candidatus Omnitrophota bacterium]